MRFSDLQPGAVEADQPPQLDPNDPTKGKYFPVEVASNVPRVFLILAVIYLIMEVIGLLLIVEPTEEELEGLKEKHLPIAADPKSERASRHVIPRESDWLHAS